MNLIDQNIAPPPNYTGESKTTQTTKAATPEEKIKAAKQQLVDKVTASIKALFITDADSYNRSKTAPLPGERCLKGIYIDPETGIKLPTYIVTSTILARLKTEGHDEYYKAIMESKIKKACYDFLLVEAAAQFSLDDGAFNVKFIENITDSNDSFIIKSAVLSTMQALEKVKSPILASSAFWQTK